MLDLLNSGKLRMASATSFSLSPDAAALNADMARFRHKMILRPQEISNLVACLLICLVSTKHDGREHRRAENRRLRASSVDL